MVHKRRRLIILAVLAAILALTGSLPLFLSHPLMLPHIVGALAPDLPGRIEVQSCTLSWWRGLACTDIRYQPPGGGLRLTLPRVHTDKGLMALLLAPQYLGEITLEQPVLHVVPPDAQDEREAAMTTPGSEQGPHQAPASWWERWRLGLIIHDGRVFVEGQGTAQPRLLVQAVELSSELAQGSLNYHLAGHSGEMAGQFEAKGFVNLPVTDQPWLPSLISQASLQVRDLPMKPLLELLADRLPGMPRGQGILDASCRLRTAGSQQIELEGESTLREMALRGGVLGEDQPQLRHLGFQFQGSRHPTEGWRLTRLDLQSEPLRFAARGFLDSQRVDFTAQGEADLALLAGQVPRLLALHRQTIVHQSHLQLALQAAGPLHAFKMQGDCQTDRLHISQEGHSYSWEKPLQLHAEAHADRHGVHIDRLSAQAPFFRADGTADSDGFSLRVNAELDRLFGELQKIFALDLHARGQLRLDAATSISAAMAQVESSLQINDLLLMRGGEILLPRHDLKLRAAWAGSLWPPGGLRALRLQCSAWPGELELEARDIIPGGAAASTAPANCRLGGRLQLERLQGLGRLMPDWQPELTTAGGLRFAVTGQWRGSELRIDTLQGEIENFRLLAGTTPLLREQRLRLALEHRPLALGNVNLGELMVVDGHEDLPAAEPAMAHISLDPLRLDLRHLLVRGAALTVDAGAHLARGAGDAATRLDVLALGKLDLLTPWCRQQGWLGAKATLAGQGRARLSLRRGLDGQETDLKLLARNMLIMQGKRRIYADPQVELGVRLRSQPGGEGILALPQCSLRSSLFTFAGSGQLHRRAHPHLLEAQGQLEPAATLLSSVASELVPGTLVTLRGAQSGSLLLSAPLALPVDVRNLTLAAQLPVSELRLGGVQLRDLTLPLELNRGVLHVSVVGDAEGGRVNLQPQWTWPPGQEAAPQLTMASASEVLRRVPLSRALNGGLLSHLPPLGCLVQGTGTLDLSLTRFSLPLGGKRQADFALRLGLDQAKPQAMPVLRELLATAGLAQLPLRFKEPALTCEAKEGAVHCDPLMLLAGDAEIELRGGVQGDGTLAYRVAIPVGEKLAQEAGVVVHGPFVVAADISGTRAEPHFDRQGFLGSLAAQLAASLPPPAMEQGGTSAATVGKEGEPAPPPAPPAPL